MHDSQCKKKTLQQRNMDQQKDPPLHNGELIMNLSDGQHGLTVLMLNKIRPPFLS